MHPGSDPLAPPPSFTARRSAASNLPNFELPPPPLSHLSLNHKFQPFNSIVATQPGPVSSVTSVGNLLTPPSTLQGDGLSPLSSGVTSGSSNSGQAVPPYTPTGYWPQGPTASYGYPTGTTPLGMFPPRGLFSPSSLNSIMRNSSGASPADALPPPPYDLNQLPPFPTSLSMSGPSSLPTLHAQQQAISSSYMSGQHSGPGSALPPPPQHSPPQTQDGFQQTRAPPTPTSYYNHSHSHSSSGTQQSPYNGYVSRPSPLQASPIASNGSMSHMSPASGSGEIPSLQHPPSHSPYQYQRPYGSQSLPAMNGTAMSGPVMSNLHSPSGQMALVGSMSNGLMSGFNSGHAAHMQHNMYSVHSSSQQQQQQQQQNDRPFKCDQCVQSFNRNHDLKRHKRIHLAVKPFPCRHCDKSFSRKDALKRHILVKGCGKTQPGDDSLQNDGSESPTMKSASDQSSVSPPLNNMVASAGVHE